MYTHAQKHTSNYIHIDISIHIFTCKCTYTLPYRYLHNTHTNTYYDRTYTTYKHMIFIEPIKKHNAFVHSQ